MHLGDCLASPGIALLFNSLADIKTDRHICRNRCDLLGWSIVVVLRCAAASSSGLAIFFDTHEQRRCRYDAATAAWRQSPERLRSDQPPFRRDQHRLHRHGRADNGRRVFAARNRNQWSGGTLVMRSVFKPPSPNRPAVRALIRSGTAGSGPIRAPGGGPGWPQRPTTRARGPALLFSYGSGPTPRCKRHNLPFPVRPVGDDRTKARGSDAKAR